jgi:RHS repeat-associated protein
MGRAVWTTDRYRAGTQVTFDSGGDVSDITDGNVVTALATKTLYDSAGRTIASVRAKNVLVTLGVDQSISTTENAPPIRFSSVASEGSTLSSTSTQYDGNGRVWRQTNADGVVTQTTYFDNGQSKKVETISSLGTQTTEYDYRVGSVPVDVDSPNGAQITVRQDVTIVHPLIRPNSQDPDDPRTTVTCYDALGRVFRVIHPDGSVTETGYENVLDTTGRITGTRTHKTAQRLPNGPTHPDEARIVTDSNYDLAGRLTSVLMRDPDQDGPLGDALWQYGYDANGNKTSITDPRSTTSWPIVTKFAYDDFGRRISRQLPEGQTETWAYEAPSASSHGRLVKHVDFKGQSTRYVYDNSAQHGGRVLEEWRYEAGQSASSDTAASEKTVYAYYDDRLGQQKTVEEYKKAAGDPTTAFALQVRTSYDYDPITGGMTNRSITGTAAGTLAVSYTYDPATGRHLTTSTGKTLTEYGYDQLGRLKTVTVKRRNGKPAEHLDGGVDGDGNPTYTAGDDVTTYAYDPLGNLQSTTLPNGVKTSYVYDTLNRLTHETVQKVSSSGSVERTLADYAYTLRSDGQRKSVDESTWDDDGNSLGTVHIAWEYDDWNRLIEEKRGSAGQSGYYDATYLYDLVGNRREKHVDTDGQAGAEQSITYSYTDSLGHLNRNDWLLKEESSGVYTITYAYDTNGSLAIRSVTQGSVPDGRTTAKYRYDLRNRLLRLDASGGTVTGSGGNGSDDPNSLNGWTDSGDILYVYDPEGNRIGRITGGGNAITGINSRWYNIDADNPTGYAQVLEEINANTSAVAQTYDVGQDVIAQTTGITSSVTHASPQYLVYDGHGTTRLLVDAVAKIVVDGSSRQQRYDYDAFGNAIFSVSGLTPSNAQTKLLYDGEFFDSGLKFYNLRFRPSYDTALGRFVTSDDASHNINSDPLTLHQYVFGAANPVLYIDPSGHSFFSYVEQLMVIGLSALMRAGDAAKNGIAATHVWWAMHPFIANAAALGVSALTWYQTLTDEEFRAFVLSQPNAMGFLEGEINTLCRSARNLSTLAQDGAAALADLQAIRSVLQKGSSGAAPMRIDRTLAFGTLQADGMAMTRIANSGASAPGTVPEVADPRYISQRAQDAEQKLYEYFADFLRPGSTGILKIALDHPEGPCDQCQSIAKQFKRDFPGIKLVIQYLTPAPIPWTGG